MNYTLISGPATVSGDILTVTGAGLVDVEADQGGNATYAAAHPVDESFTVNPAQLTITANPATKVYGAAVPSLSASYSGFVNGDTVASLTAPATLTTTATASSPVGTYQITASEATDPNYAITYQTGTLTVTPASLTVTATNESMTYGGTVPTLTYTYTGLVNKDTSATFTGSLSTTATSSSNVGGYPITQGTLAATGNYTISTYGPGTLTVIAAPLTVTATNESMTYGGTVPTLTYTYTGLVNKDTSATFTGSLVTTATSSSNVGGYPITQGNLAATGNYTIGTYDPGTLTVIAAPLTVTATNESMMYGGIVPVLGYAYTGVVNGGTSPTFSGSLATTATSSSNVGDYPITQGTLAATGNYTINTFNASTLSIAKANAIVVVTPYSVVYNGEAHTATGIATGVNGVSLNGLVVNSTHTNAGTYSDTWTFTDTTGNYNNASGVVVDTINPVPAPQPYKLVKEVELVPVTKLVKVAELVPVVEMVKVTKLVPVTKLVKVHNKLVQEIKLVKETELVQETKLVKETKLVQEIKLVKKIELVKVYY